MNASFGGAGSQLAVHSEAFASGDQQRQQHDGEGVEQQEAVSALRVIDPQRAHAHSKAKVLAVAEAGFDCPPFGVHFDDLRCGERAIAGGEMPSFLHARRLHAHDRPDLLAGGGYLGVAQFPRASTLADPISELPTYRQPATLTWVLERKRMTY